VRLGVDFGTTHTVVAYADRGNYPVLSFADEAGDFHEWFPSIVAETSGRLHFGFEALALSEGEAAADRPADCVVVRSFKRLLGDLHAIPSTPVRVGALSLTLGELIGAFLSALKCAILTASNLPPELKAKAERTRVIEAVIAVPAHAHGAQRFVTLDAFRRAGFTPIAMLNEPSAAGFEFAHRHSTALNARRDHVVVYDLGGGTFDASLVRMRGKHHEVLGTAGLGQLGGDDFDRVLLDCVLESAGLAESALSERAYGRLLEQCCEAKERLSPSSRKLAIDLEAALGAGQDPSQVAIPVDKFYDACTPLVERTVETMLPVMASFEGALTADASAGSNIAGIYVVGGASSLPLVPRQLRKHFGRRVHKSPYPSAAVAIGLAIASDDALGFELADRYAHTFGVFREGAEGLQIIFDPIFTRETSVPSRSGHVLSFRRSYRAAHNVGHFRFLECTAVSSDGRPCGDVVPSGDVFFPFDATLREEALDLAAVPVQRTVGRGPHIEEEYTLDEHGMVAVTIRNIDADYQRVYRIGGLEGRTG
jgi:molecular chaperone DnaK (HSP70)